jgi:hypothetical protein
MECEDGTKTYKGLSPFTTTWQILKKGNIEILTDPNPPGAPPYYFVDPYGVSHDPYSEPEYAGLTGGFASQMYGCIYLSDCAFGYLGYEWYIDGEPVPQSECCPDFTTCYGYNQFVGGTWPDGFGGTPQAAAPGPGYMIFGVPDVWIPGKIENGAMIGYDCDNIFAGTNLAMVGSGCSLSCTPIVSPPVPPESVYYYCMGTCTQDDGTATFEFMGECTGRFDLLYESATWLGGYGRCCEPTSDPDAVPPFRLKVECDALGGTWYNTTYAQTCNQLANPFP